MKINIINMYNVYLEVTVFLWLFRTCILEIGCIQVQKIVVMEKSNDVFYGT